MIATVPVPLWLLVAAGVLALIALLDHLLLPGARWYLRGRVNRMVSELNLRLHLKIRPFELTRRQVLVDRLIYDPEVLEAAEAKAQEEGIPREVVMKEVARYAREIVPAFNAYFYFRLGCWLARLIARSLYRVRMGYVDEGGLAAIPEDASVVFVMNHRSNMDYVLVSYLAASRTALSYAVGEWARVWPLQTLIRSLGAYFIRRNSRSNPLYRKVLERYVAMATRAGVVQAVYPEGHLSRDGRMAEPRLGLLSYMVRAFDPEEGRDLVFVPVGINYDRVLEDRTLLLDRGEGAPRRGRAHTAWRTLTFLLHNLGLALRGGWYRFGYACVNFGTPLSVRGFHDRDGTASGRPRPDVADLGRELMDRVAAVIPVLPVAVVAAVMVQNAERSLSDLELKAAAHGLMERLEQTGARVYVPRADRDYAVTVGLRTLTLRHLVETRGGLHRVVESERPLIEYYANSIRDCTPLDLTSLED